VSTVPSANEGKDRVSGELLKWGEFEGFSDFDRMLHAQPEQVLRYLGRYTHRIAISNHRLVAFDGRNVTFRWRDYARGNKQRLMTVSADEFIRRFLVHVLPKGFVRIRHFGFMANYQRSSSLELCRQRLGMAPMIRSTEISLTGPCWTCPQCGGVMTVVERLTAAQIMWRFVSKCFSATS
jgi:Putative transposase